MFPYPSGMLHMGHSRVYSITDLLVRYAKSRDAAGLLKDSNTKTADGLESLVKTVDQTVFSPMGWDSFGLPAEVAAENRNIDPKTWTETNIQQMKSQLLELDTNFNFKNELFTHTPLYYKWSQWLFTQLYDNGLVYRKEANVKWDPVLKTVLANEQIVGNISDRSGAVVQDKVLTQWFIKTTAYKERLIDDLKLLKDWPSDLLAAHRMFITGNGTEESSGLHDWLVSRQRKWGTPVPIIHCKNCGTVPVPTQKLPVLNPLSKDYHEISKLDECPKCKSKSFKYDSDTLDTFVDSSFYWLRFLDPHNDNELCSLTKSKNFLPIQYYIGGKEHLGLHLVYARFITKFLYDIGICKNKEPFTKFIGVGTVTAPTFSIYQNNENSSLNRKKYISPKDIHKYDNNQILETTEKMSKSKLNGIDPSTFMKDNGSDVLRLYILHRAPIEKSLEWNEKSIAGAKHFTIKVKDLSNRLSMKSLINNSDVQSKEMNLKASDLCLSVLDALDNLRPNVAVGKLFEILDLLSNDDYITSDHADVFSIFLRLLYPITPRLALNCWNRAFKDKNKNLLCISPIYELKPTQDFTILLAYNSKVFLKLFDKDSALLLKMIGKDKRLDNLKIKPILLELLTKMIDTDHQKEITNLHKIKKVPKVEFINNIINSSTLGLYASNINFKGKMVMINIVDKLK